MAATKGQQIRTLDQDTILSEPDKVLLETVRDTVRHFVPSAQVLLYGSVARGDRQPYSDYDFLVLTDRALSRAGEEAVEDALYDLQLNEGALIVAGFDTKDAWESNPSMPLYEEIEKDAVVL